MPSLDVSLQAQIHALKAIIDEQDRRLIAIINERDERYKVQFLTLADASELNNKAVGIAMNAADKAVTKAENAVEKRFESVNEFRAQMGDMQSSFARADMMNSRFQSLEKKLDEMAEFKTGSIARRSGYSEIWGWLVGLIGIALAVATVLVRLFP